MYRILREIQSFQEKIMEDSNLIVEKISKILDLAKEVNDKDPGIGLVLNFCLKQFMDLVEAKENQSIFNINEFIDFASKFLNFNFRSDGDESTIVDDHVDESVVDYILKNSSDIDAKKISEYEDFINKSIKKIQKAI